MLLPRQLTARDFTVFRLQPTGCSKGIINGIEAGKGVALPKLSDMLTLSQSEGSDYAQP